jgi:ATP synthase protein I
MNVSKSNLKLAQRVTYFLISVAMIVWAIQPDYKPLMGGLIIGLAGSLAITWHLYWKTVKLAEIVAKTASKPRFNLGFLTRACIAVLAYVISNNVFHFNFYMTIIGLIFVQLVTIVLIRKNQSIVERGEKEKWNI